MDAQFDIVIVGAGHAGAQLAISLRQNKYEGTIALLGDEKVLPYERPPLSKEYLAGDKSFERIMLRPESFWAERNVKIMLGHRVTEVDMAAKSVTCSKGQTIGFGKLVWAAGGSPRMLPLAGANAAQVHYVRRKTDADAIMEQLPNVENIVVIGGGYIGLEAAAVLRKFGKNVALVEALDHVLSRVAGEPLSRFYEKEHADHGVSLHLGIGVEAIITDETGNVAGVKLTGGETLPADMVIVGIGIIPDVGPLITAGAAGGNGIDVDEYCRTSLPDVYAIGDCAQHANAYAEGAMIRLESVQNAADMARTVAADISGEPKPYDAVPWFWSNQYDLKLQTVGLSIGFDETVVRGDPDSRSFSVAYLREGKLIAMDCVNKAKDFIQGKMMVVEGAVFDKEDLADGTKPLKEVQRA